MRTIGLGLLVVVCAACGDSPRRGTVPFDSGMGSRDTGVIGIDSGRRDSGGIVLVDGGRDAGVIRLDAGRDAGRRDAGFDAGRDSGPPLGVCRDLGMACDPTLGCMLGECEDRLGAASTIGGSSDPILGHPGGASATVMTDFLPNNYCTTEPYNLVGSGGCDPDDPTTCGGCETCLSFGSDDAGNEYSMCMLTCTPSLTTNPCPEADQECSLGSKVCLGGCDSDDQCALYRDDTNGNGTIDPYDPVSNPSGDNWRYDTTGSWTCNTTTRRCEHTPPAGANAGDACTRDSQCELYGRCVTAPETDGEWPGGYCIKFGCDVPGNSCASGGVCDDNLFGAPTCLAPCRVAAPTTTGDIFSNARDCRTGYACYWDGISGAVAGNGRCIPGEYNSIRTPNIGADCSGTSGTGDDSLCYSPYGLGRCLDFGLGAPSCAVFDCGAPGVSSTVCGSGATCASVTASSTTLCLETCTGASTCATGYGCWDTTSFGIDTGGVRVCYPGCMLSTDCRTGESCVGASGTTPGQCL